MAPVSPAIMYDLTAEVLGVSYDALQAVLPAELRPGPGDVAIVNGPPSVERWLEQGWDGCGAMLHAWCSFITPTQAPPTPQAGLVICRPPSPMFQISVQSYRCEPTITAKGGKHYLPSAVDLDYAARQVYVDGFTVWAALGCWAAAREQDETDPDDPEGPDLPGVSIAMGVSSAVPPQGGVAGWLNTVTVILDGSQSCCDEGAVTLDALPTGFLDPPA
jgi:hypothetical protein